MNKETQLTVEQRLEAYKWAKENFRDPYNGPYLCNVLARWYEERNEEFYEKMFRLGFRRNFIRKKVVNEQFPEFIKYWSGKNLGDDNSQREGLLDECIKECEEKLLTSKNNTANE